MSRRKRPRPDAAAAPTRPERADPPRRGPGLLAQVALLAAVFAAATLVAELAGAANLGVAIGVGQVAFTVALVILLVRAP